MWRDHGVECVRRDFETDQSVEPKSLGLQSGHVTNREKDFVSDCWLDARLNFDLDQAAWAYSVRQGSCSAEAT